MCFVTYCAAVILHCVRVRQMTIATGLNLSMVVMACGTCQFCMNTWVTLQLFHLFLMTAQAGHGDVMGHVDFKGRMGINMTGHTVLQLEVIPVVTMATATEWNDPYICRRMALVAFPAESLVSFSFYSNCKNNLFMALAAVTHIDCSFDNIFVLFCLCRKVRNENAKHAEANKT